MMKLTQPFVSTRKWTADKDDGYEYHAEGGFDDAQEAGTENAEHDRDESRRSQ